MNFKLPRTLRFRGLLIGLCCAAICWVLNQTTVVRNLENWSFDTCFVVRESFRDPALQSDDIVIVALDDDWNESFTKPKMYITPELAQVVDYIQAHGATAIGIDLLIPDVVHEHEGLQRQGQGNAFALSDLNEAEWVNPGSRCPVVLPESFLKSDSTSDTEPFRETSDASRLSGVTEHLIFPVRQWKYNFPVPSYESLALYDEPWNELGFVNVNHDADNTVRRQLLRLEMPAGESRFEPSFSTAVFASAKNLSQDFLQDLSTPDGEWMIPHANGEILINYRGSTNCFEQIPVLDVLAAAEHPDTPPSFSTDLEGKIVLIGETYRFSPDQMATPFNNQSITRMMWGQAQSFTPGVEIHAHTIQTILDQRFITTPLLLATPILLFAWGGFLGLVLINASLEKGFLIAFLHHWLWKLVCIVAFIVFDWRIEMVSVLLLGGLIFAVSFSMRWRWIRRMMGMVKSEEIARALEEDPSKLDLRGDDRVITILFSDIRDFTTFSESHTAQQVVTMLNEYFAIVVPIIEKHGGVVDKYMGDGVMVLFGAPRQQHDHAGNALRAAIAMVAAVHQHRPRWASLDAPELRIGVGVHTGSCVVGTIGSPNRLDYTAIGDTTNTAARIEAGNKQLGTEILVSAATVGTIAPESRDLRSQLSDAKTLLVKGKQDHVVVHEIVVHDRP